jgi:hypothetical protein
LGLIGDQAITFELPVGRYSCRRRTTERAHDSVASDGWPYFFAEIHLPDQAGAQIYNGEELTAPNEPFFASPAQAAAELLFGIPMNAQGNDLTLRILIALSDPRGAIERVRFSEGALRVRARGVDPSRLTLRATWRTADDDVAWQHEDRTFNDDEAAFETDAMPYEATLLLVSADGEKLDRRAWTANYGERPDIDVATPVEQVERWLIEREHGSLEYKQELGKDNNDAFAKDVCAFANTDGGVVLLGVSDQGEVIGYPLRGMPSRNVPDQITHVISNLIEPAPRYEIEAMEIRGLPLWIVRVPEGADKPYTIDDKVYVRDHGISRPAKRNELLSLIPRLPNVTGILGR